MTERFFPAAHLRAHGYDVTSTIRQAYNETVGTLNLGCGRLISGNTASPSKHLPKEKVKDFPPTWVGIVVSSIVRFSRLVSDYRHND